MKIFPARCRNSCVVISCVLFAAGVLPGRADPGAKVTASFSGQIKAVAADTNGVPLELVNRARGALPVILPANAAPHTRQAAHYLAECIEKIGGVRPAVLEKLPEPLPAQAVWVGYQPAMAALFPGVDFSFNHHEEILLTANANHVAITGRDRWDPQYPTMPTQRRFPIENKQQEYGNANAVYTFLQDVLGMRWLYPGKLGTDYPGPEALRILPFAKRQHPQFRARIGLFYQLESGYAKNDICQEWVKHQRLLLDSLHLDGGHYFRDWWDKYGATRPELFALQPDGTRGTYPTDTHRRKLCEGEPAVWNLWLQEQEERLAKYPYYNTFGAMPNDGYYDGHCTDPRSRAWDPDPAATGIRVKLNWAGGVSAEWPPLSDRYVTFANTLGELLAKRFPGKEYRVAANAYGEVGLPLPVRARPRDNVLIIGVHNFHMRHPQDRQKGMKGFADWAAISKNIVWRPNLGNQAGLQWGLPDVPLTQAIEDFRFVAEHGAVGVFFDSLFEHWAPLAPYYYLISQLAWDPKADGNAILEDYYKRCYGPAAATMKKYWQLMEATRQRMVDKVPSRFRAFKIYEFFTAEVVAQAESYLDEAEKLTAADAKYAARVNFSRCGFRYARTIVEIRALMHKLEESKLKDKEVEKAILEKWDGLTKMVAAFPEAAVNFKRFTPGKGNQRVMGLHPVFPTQAKRLRDITDAGLDLD
jgi:hypothetical protein